MDWIQHRDYYPADRSIDVQVSRLRKRLQVRAGEPPLIQTVRNVGYLFTVDAEWVDP